MALLEAKRRQRPIPFIGGAYKSDSLAVSAQECINCYPEIGEQAANAVVLQGIPGSVLLVDLGAPIRGMFRGFGAFYVAAGHHVYRIDSVGVTVDLGEISNISSQPVGFSQNIFEVLIVSDGLGYVVQEGASTLTEISDAEFPDTTKCDFIDGYGLLIERGSGRFWYTTINDFESISGIDFATAEGSPDDLVSLLVDHREVWLFGESSTEVWYNVGDNTNPFQRVSGGFIERGCSGAYSPAKLDNTVFWLGDDRVVYRADGLTPIRISNHGIEDLIAKTTAEPVGSSHTRNGHSFYQLHFKGQLTIVYDASTQAWHTRKNLNRPDAVAAYTASAHGRQYVGGDDGKVYYLDDSVYTFDGEPIERVRAIGPIRTDGFTVTRSLFAGFETGINSGPVNPSKVFLEISDDQGRTFGSRFEASTGTTGQYGGEVKFNGLGGFYDNQRVLRLTMTDDSRFSLVSVSVI